MQGFINNLVKLDKYYFNFLKNFIMNKISRLKRLGLLFLSVLFFNISYSQENYIPGYIIKNNNDSLNGFIDYRKWEFNPDKISFKTSINSSSILLKSTDIIRFSIQNEIYVSGIIDVEVTSLLASDLKKDSKIIIKVDTIFLKTIIEGKKSLYYYKNHAERKNFYIKNGTDFELLVYKKYLKQHGDKRAIVENNRYLGQLLLYLNDCPSINKKIERTSYSIRSLKSLFIEYYECSKLLVHFLYKKEKQPLDFGLLAGLSMTTVEFIGENFDFLEKSDFSTSSNFTAGLFLDIGLPISQNKWSIFNELRFSSYNITGLYEEFIHENRYTKLQLSYNFHI